MESQGRQPTSQVSLIIMEFLQYLSHLRYYFSTTMLHFREFNRIDKIRIGGDLKSNGQGSVPQCWTVKASQASDCLPYLMTSWRTLSREWWHALMSTPLTSGILKGSIKTSLKLLSGPFLEVLNGCYTSYSFIRPKRAKNVMLIKKMKIHLMKCHP
jgi:hypothetical protein